MSGVFSKAGMLAVLGAGAASFSVWAAPAAGGGGAGTPPDLRDIAPLVEIPFWTMERIAWAALAGGVALFLVGWMIRAWMRRPRSGPSLPSPRDVAFRELERLRGAEGAALDSRDFAAALSEVLRRYLEIIHRIGVTRQTTAEFLRGIDESTRFSEEEKVQLRRFLAHCDRLKFAGVEAEAGLRVELLDLATGLIRGVHSPATGGVS